MRIAAETVMTRISFEIDDAVLALVEQHAEDTHTSVEKIVTEHLEGLARQNDPERAARSRQELVRLSEESTARMGSWKWNREDAYEGRIFSKAPFHAIRSKTRTSLPLKGGGPGWGSFVNGVEFAFQSNS
jgi:hypothetical protein